MASVSLYHNHNDEAAMRRDFVLHGQRQRHNDEAGMRETRLTPTTKRQQRTGREALAGLEKGGFFAFKKAVCCFKKKQNSAACYEEQSYDSNRRGHHCRYIETEDITLDIGQ